MVSYYRRITLLTDDNRDFDVLFRRLNVDTAEYRGEKSYPSDALHTRHRSDKMDAR